MMAPDEIRPGPSLPSQLTSFVGREREAESIGTLLRQDHVRLVTLTGSGGIGKTRLAIRVAGALGAEFADGVAFVPLASTGEPGLVALAVAHALGLRQEGDSDPLAQIAAFLRDRSLLLVLDNFEHLVEAGVIGAHLLSRCPLLKVLVTSRTVLKVSGEHQVEVPPLALPDAVGSDSPEEIRASEAVRLFAERARSARATFALTDDNIAAVSAICTQLDGLPLAIELAAARANVLPPRTMLTRLETRLSFLTGGPRDAPARFQTMRDAIAWSYDLLEPEERVLFRRLAVFVGGFTVDAASAVAGAGSDVFEGVAQLVSKSLLRQDEGPGGEPRFAMLEMVREFAWERLVDTGEVDTFEHRRANWVLTLAELENREMQGPEPGIWRDRLAADAGNLRAALGWTLATGHIELGLRLTFALRWSWHSWASLTEGNRWQERLLATGADFPPLVRARAMGAAGILTYLTNSQGTVAFLEESLALAREVGDDEVTAEALFWLGRVAGDHNDLDRQAELLVKARDLYRRAGNRPEAAWTTLAIGESERKRRGLPWARAHYEEALAEFRTQRNADGCTWATTALADIAVFEGDSGRAFQLYRETLGEHAANREPGGVISCLVGLARVAAALGNPVVTAKLRGAAAAQCDAAGYANRLDDSTPDEEILARMRAGLSEDEFAAAFAAGRTLSMEQAIAEVARLLGETVDSPPATSGLTSREVEILRLLAEGRTDPEIAAELFISLRTVEWHVANLLRKLGLRTRTAAATHAVRHGLV
jgi:non-specific serine/threonine protein kinase